MGVKSTGEVILSQDTGVEESLRAVWQNERKKRLHSTMDEGWKAKVGRRLSKGKAHQRIALKEKLLMGR